MTEPIVTKATGLPPIPRLSKVFFFIGVIVFLITVIMGWMNQMMIHPNMMFYSFVLNIQLTAGWGLIFSLPFTLMAVTEWVLSLSLLRIDSNQEKDN